MVHCHGKKQDVITEAKSFDAKNTCTVQDMSYKTMHRRMPCHSGGIDITCNAWPIRRWLAIKQGCRQVRHPSSQGKPVAAANNGACAAWREPPRLQPWAAQPMLDLCQLQGYVKLGLSGLLPIEAPRSQPAVGGMFAVGGTFPDMLFALSRACRKEASRRDKAFALNSRRGKGTQESSGSLSLSVS